MNISLKQGFVAAISAALAAAVVATLLIVTSSRSSNDPAPVGHVTKVSTASESPALAGFSGLAGAPEASAVDAASVRENLDNRSSDPSATGADLLPVAVTLADDYGGRTVVAAGPKYVCMENHVEGVQSSACTTHASAANSSTPLVDVVEIENGRFLVSALLPDGVSSAHIKTAGASTELKIANNIAVAVVSDRPVSVVARGAKGDVTVPVSAG